MAEAEDFRKEVEDPVPDEGQITELYAEHHSHFLMLSHKR